MAKIVRRFVVNKPKDEVISDLEKEGYQVTGEKGAATYLRPGKNTIKRVAKSKDN